MTLHTTNSTNTDHYHLIVSQIQLNFELDYQRIFIFSPKQNVLHQTPISFCLNAIVHNFNCDATETASLSHKPVFEGFFQNPQYDQQLHQVDDFSTKTLSLVLYCAAESLRTINFYLAPKFLLNHRNKLSGKATLDNSAGFS